MLSFWKKFFGTTLGKTCSGVCRPIVTHVVKPDGSELLEVDPRYYAVIGLCLERLTFEVIVHESIHAGFAYSNRKAGRFEWRIDEDDLDDEEVCYPSGRIASAIIRTLIADGYENQPQLKALPNLRFSRTAGSCAAANRPGSTRTHNTGPSGCRF